MTIELRYTLWQYGWEKSMDIPEDVTNLFIGDYHARGIKIIARKGLDVVAEKRISQIEKLDLSELAGCQKLEKLSLEWNSYLVGLDLTPLASCKNLTTVKIVGTGRFREETEQLDLSPLASCPSLSRLVLSNNGLYEQYDLRPLIHCPNLRVLDLAELSSSSRYQ